MEIKTENGFHNVAGGGTTALGIIGTVLGGAAVLGLGAKGLNPNNNGGGPDNDYATRGDLVFAQQLAQKDAEIALLKSEHNIDVKIADVYERVLTRVNADKFEQSQWNAAQNVNNATMSAAIAANTASISALQGITKTVVPITAVCPQPMAQYNSWTAPTTTTTTTA